MRLAASPRASSCFLQSRPAPPPSPTYEDLFPDPETRAAELERFGARFDSDPLPEPTPIAADLARDERDRIHLLLVARCKHVDAVYRTLSEDVQERIAELVRSMAAGMVWSTERSTNTADG